MKQTTMPNKTKQITHFDLVYKDALKNMVSILESFFDNSKTRRQLADSLNDYAYAEGRQAIIDLYAWIQYARNINLKAHMIDVLHDLTCYDGGFFTPRTEGYAVEMYGEGFVNYQFS